MPCLSTLVFILLFLPFLGGCDNTSKDLFQGYVEGEYVQVGSPLAGDLEVLAVRRGETISVGDLLFRLEHSLDSAALAEARQKSAEAVSRLMDLTKGLRPTEIQSLEARLAQARAEHELAQTEHDRMERLLAEDRVSREDFDRAASRLKQTAAAIREVTAEMETAALGARSDLIDAARAEVQAARARVDQAEWKLDQKSRFAPEAGLVFDTYYSPGEFVREGFPVVSLLPPGRIYLRFFVPESLAGTFRTGQRVEYSFDGSQGMHHATISYISPQAEYTPPVIYSRETRSKLIFMVEATPEPADADGLHPGQPIDVSLPAEP